MELKEYQQKALDQIKQYLELLAKERQSGNLKHASLDAWQAVGLKNYLERQNGLGQDLPNFCLKIPTGGGKTFLAVKAIDLINTIYRKKQNGLILWIVPTTQIYRQTIQSLRNRDHPYRQHLDIASAGRTIILEKSDRFTPLDIKENLVILMLMLPSAARKTKEVLRVFKDNGGFTQFFPAEDDYSGHNRLLEQYPNLDTFGNEDEFWGRQIKTSLGNTLRLLSPVIILDEGHKAYSQTAQETLRGFNPSIILELSATPSKKSNILVDIRGLELKREEMIKLDLHIFNKASLDWKDTLLASVNHRNLLEERAKAYEANTSSYIRPICLIQVERTGRDQRSGQYIHSEDVREHLVKVLGIPQEQVAVKTSEKDELKEVDDIGGLMSKNTQIRYIITKQALQEGWDCAFAYILTILNNPTSQNALTQLVGRILRQPFAKKTKIEELDESYVFTYQQRAVDLLKNIRDGFEKEGLGDLTGQIATDEGFENELTVKEQTHQVREKFSKAVKQTILPVFVIQNSSGWRLVNYEMDIIGRINWNHVNLKPLFSLILSQVEEKDTEHITTLSEDIETLIEQRKVLRLREGGIKLDSVFLARHLMDIVPNPWVAYELGKKVLKQLLRNHDQKLVVNNFVFIIEEIRKHLIQEKDRLAKDVFLKLLSEKSLRFLVIGKNLGFRLPEKRKVKTTLRTLTRLDGQPLQRSLFEFVPEEEFNEVEKAVAWYLENQDKLFFWYRNIAKQDYAIQGWRKHKIYPDFILAVSKTQKADKYNKVYVVETKGLHLKNEDTEYKKSVFEICNKYAEEKRLEELGFALKNKTIHFKVLFEDEWKKKLNELFSSDDYL